MHLAPDKLENLSYTLGTVESVEPSVERDDEQHAQHGDGDRYAIGDSANPPDHPAELDRVVEVRER